MEKKILDQRIMQSSNSVQCETYTCNEYSKYIIARHDVDSSIQLSVGMRLCEGCARNLAQHIPIELFSGMAIDTESRIRKEEREKVEAEVRDAVSLELNQLKASIQTAKEEAQMKAEALAETMVDQLKNAAAGKTEDDEDNTPGDYRCLECGTDLPNKTQYKRHLADHKKAELAKGNG